MEDRQRRITELEELHHNDERRLRTRQHEIDKLKDSQRLLRAEQESLQLLTDQAIASAGKATKEVLTLREEHQKLWNEREAVLKNLANEKEKDEELRKYKGFCDDYKKKVCLHYLYRCVGRSDDTSRFFAGNAEQGKDEGSTSNE